MTLKAVSSTVDNSDVASEIQKMEAFFMPRIIGFVYLHLTKPVFEGLGMEGEKAIREGLRAFGRYRGRRVKKWHVEENLPLNLESFLRFWDVQSVRGCGAVNPEMVLKPHYANFKATHCTLHDVCKENDFEHWGYIYCDEIHQESLMAYQPDGICEIHEALMKDDGMCHFRVSLPRKCENEAIGGSAYDKLENKIKSNPIEWTRIFLRKEANMVAMLYYFISRAIVDRFKDKGKEIVENAAKLIGQSCGKEIKKAIIDKNLTITMPNVIENFYLPYTYAWEMDDIELSEDKLVAEIGYCPLAEIWKDVGDTEIGALYCQNIYHNMFKALSDDYTLNISKCMTNGSSKCKFEFSL